MPTILCYGDSNTYGFDPATFERYPPGVRWPGVLRRELGKDCEVIEEGLNGRTTMWEDPFTEGRNGRTYLLPCLRSHAPVDVVTLLLGTNDLKTIFRLEAAEIAAGVESLVELIQRSGTGVNGRAPDALLVAPPRLGSRTRHSELWGFGLAIEKSAKLPALYRTVAEHTGCLMLDASERAAPSPLDGVHLDSDGHQRLGKAIAGAVASALLARAG